MRDRKESAGAFDDSLLSDDELLRYSRHIMLDQFDLAGQERLKQAHVLSWVAVGLAWRLFLFLLVLESENHIGGL
ncbi:hypothetical protein [Ignatzschineria indica]|uniref:hypothetical protein n=1 Tax=Ignatzschineria indica TaxID=472583 RepID=UPI0036258BDF